MVLYAGAGWSRASLGAQAQAEPPACAVRHACRSGGVQGGISNGEDIVLRVAFKPTATIARRQNTVSRAGEEMELLARGRHDPCVVPRAVPMVEAVVALVLADQLLQHYAQCELLPRDDALGPDVKVAQQFCRQQPQQQQHAVQA